MQEVIERREVLVSRGEGGGRGKGGVDSGGGEGDVVYGCEAEEESRRKGSFNMKVMLAFRKSLEEVVDVTGEAHLEDGEEGFVGWKEGRKTRKSDDRAVYISIGE